MDQHDAPLAKEETKDEEITIVIKELTQIKPNFFVITVTQMNHLETQEYSQKELFSQEDQGKLVTEGRRILVKIDHD